MNTRTLHSLAAALGFLAFPVVAHAQSLPPSSDVGSAGPSTPAAAPAPATDSGTTADFTKEDAERAEFSGGRLVVEILASGVGGSLAAYGTYKGICEDEPCIGGWAAGAGVNIVATPLIAAGVGRVMGGRGSVATTFLVGLLGFTATAPLSADNPGLAFTVSMAAIPILAPLGFELSSGARSTEMKGQLGVAEVTPMVAPVRQGDRVVGGVLGAYGAF